VSGTVHLRAGKSKLGGFAILLFGLAAVAIFALAFVLVFAALAAGVVLIGGALALFGFRRATGRLATTEELAARHGVTPRDIERLIEQQQITPNVVINGRPMYDPRDLKDVGRLLRVASGPVIDAELLRPTGTQSLDEQLLLRSGGITTGPVDVANPSAVSESARDLPESAAD